MQSNEPNTDKYILTLFRQDKEAGFRLLIVKYREKLYYHIRRIVILHEDSDDALQNTFMKVWENLEKFRSDSSLFTWLYRIATNEALTILRKRTMKSNIDPLIIENFFYSSDEGSTWFDGDEAERKLQNAILQLPEKQRLVFNMKYYDNVKYEDMSKILETSVGALKASYHHAVKKIKVFLLSD
ncbi:MAG: RNA polymerase sigma factor [Bacteroidales bacterium]|nr:RNA polymerase sigma factor [Bacteroidales bacterium]